jgi:hypothetical protein
VEASAGLLLILAAAVALVGGALAGVLLLTVDDTPAEVQDVEEAADVTVLRCGQSRGLMTARLRVTNHSSEASDYFVDVEFFRGPARQVVDTAPAVIEDLGSGESTPVAVISVRRAPRAFDCRVGDVDRLAA